MSQGIQTQFFALGGGLDLVTPAILTPAGRVIAGMNYEPHPRGYRRVDGFERRDGQPKPSEASYWVIEFDAGVATVAEGNTVTGQTSGATGKALIAAVVESGSYGGGNAVGYLVLTNVSGTFQDNENLRVAGVTKSVANGTATEFGADNDTDDTTWTRDAIETARALIAAVPGSGPVRGTWTYDGDDYAFRDNVGGTAGVMYKATTAGWAAQALGRELTFDAGVAEFTEGQVLTGGTSGATGTITRVVLEDGGWSSAWAESGSRLPLTASATVYAVAALNDTDIALIDATNDSLSFYRTDGATWELIGTPLAIATVGSCALTALSATDVAFIDDNNDELRCYHFDGANWALVGAGFAIATVGAPALAALNGTDVAFVDATNDSLRTYRFDGAAWSLVGAGLAIATVGTPSLTKMSATRVAFFDSTNLSLRAYTWSGSAWSLTGSGLAIAGAGVASLAGLDSTDVAFIDATLDSLRTYRFSGTAWTQLGSSLAVTTVGVPAITALDSTHVAFVDITSDQLRTYVFDIDSNAEGRLIFATVTGAFVDNEVITDPLGGTARSAGADAAITLPPGGRYDFVNHNFFGSSDLKRMYGCQGEGYGFEWDGTVFVPIHTGMDTDEPVFCTVHRNHLFFGYRGGSLQNSSLGAPYQWLVITGASEIGIGEDLTGIHGSVAGAMAVFGRNKVAVLFGDDSDNWVLKTLSENAGAVAYTAQTIGVPVYLDSRGLRTLESTDAFGDFNIGTLTQLIEPLFRAKQRAGVTAIGSLRVRNKDTYRLFWSDGTGISLYFGRTPVEILPFNLGLELSCFSSGEDDNGDDVLLVGDEDGMVYQLDSGTSFDGDEVEAYLRLPFNHVGSPAQNKRWTKVTLEMDGGPDIELGVAPEFSYGDEDQPPGIEEVFNVAGSGGFYDEASYDNFYWSAPVEGQLEAPIDGIGINMSLAISSNATYESPHTIHGLMVFFTYRGLAR